MIVVTGGAGFIGSCIIKELNKRGIEDILVVDRLEKDSKYKNLIGLRIHDYIDKDEFLGLVMEGQLDTEEVTAIIHMGACSATTELDASFLMENNYRYTQHLALWCVENKKRFIYASSAATYGAGNEGYSDECDLGILKPLNPYGFSKSQFDLWAEKMDLLDEIVGLKFFNVYGPREDHKDDMRSVVNKAYDQIKAEGEMKLFKSHKEGYTDGEQLRDFVYVLDAVKVIMHFLDNENLGGVYNVGTGEARSFRDLVTATFKAMGKEVNIEYIPMPEHLRERYQYFTQAAMEKLKATGYSEPFMSIEEGVTDYVQNYLDKRD